MKKKRKIDKNAQARNLFDIFFSVIITGIIYYFVFLFYDCDKKYILFDLIRGKTKEKKMKYRCNNKNLYY